MNRTKEIEMVYLEYERYLRKYKESQRAVDAILTEKEKLFQLTQPKSIMGEYEREFDKRISVGGSGGAKVNQIEEYVIKVDELGLNEKLREAKGILSDRLLLLRQKEKELRESKNIDDELYVMRYIEQKRVRYIAKHLSYSEPQIYRRLRHIRDKIKDDRK